MLLERPKSSPPLAVFDSCKYEYVLAGHDFTRQ